MSNRNWGMIRSGGIFEGLVSALVFAEDATARLFGRRGKDGGQDVVSGDGLTVFQAKFHAAELASDAFRDAAKEAKKIAKYRQTDHPRYQQWQGVTHWCLVTNAAFNPTDWQKWAAEIVPTFRAMNLEAACWSQTDLDVRLDKHPDVDRAYFENEARAVLSLPEAEERAAIDAPFLPRAVHATLQGRHTDLAAVKDFLASDKSFLVISGPGGVGKSRLLIEAGATVAAPAGWQVLWANTATILPRSSR